jgi:dihydroflavonol-4-reductase
VARFVHVSTALVFGPASGRPRREQDGYIPAPADPYVASRIAAAEALRSLVPRGLPLVIVSPSVVFGPDHPSHPNRVTSHLRTLLRRRLAVLVSGGCQRRSLAFVDNVVRALLAAESELAPGEEVIAGGEDVSQRTLDCRALALAGRRGVLVPLPGVVATALAWLADRARGRRGGCGYLGAVRSLRREWRFDSSRAIERLRYRFTPLDEALRRTLVSIGWDVSA